MIEESPLIMDEVNGGLVELNDGVRGIGYIRNQLFLHFIHLGRCVRICAIDSVALVSTDTETHV